MFGLPIGENVGGIFAEIASFLSILLWLAPIAIIAIFVLRIVMYKYEVEVVHLTGGKKVVVRDKAKKTKDKQGVEKLQLKKTRERIAMPPDEVCETNQRGKIHCSVYRTQNGQYIWRKDNGLVDENGKPRIKLPEGAIEEDFTPLNTMNRSFYADEWEEAQKYKTSNVWDTIKSVAHVMGIVIMVVMLIIYWQDITGPIKDVQDAQTEQLKIQQDIAEKQSRMMSQLVREYVPEDEQIPEQEEEDNTGGTDG